MSKQYVAMLVESLEKKIKVLEEIQRISQLQEEILSVSPMDFEQFDSCVDSKDVCIEKLTKLDEGFETLYDRVRQEFLKDRDAYGEQIARMQELISRITDLSVAIQALEERNKKGVEQVILEERKELKKGRRSMSAARNYYRSMNAAGTSEAQFMDKKK